MENQPHKRRLQAPETICKYEIFCRWIRLTPAWRKGVESSRMEARGRICNAAHAVAKMRHPTHGCGDRSGCCSHSAGRGDAGPGAPLTGVAPCPREVLAVDRMLTMTCDGAACRRLWWESVPAKSGRRPKGGGRASAGRGKGSSTSEAILDWRGEQGETRRGVHAGWSARAAIGLRVNRPAWRSRRRTRPDRSPGRHGRAMLFAGAR
jgi:hypothetical protein